MQKIIEISDYELERGKPMPSVNHAQIQARMIIKLSKYEDRFSVMSELSLELDAEYFTPDISLLPVFVPDFMNDEVRYAKPPVCAIEILSPTQILGDLIIKMHKLIDAGVKSYWIVVPPTKTIFMFNHKKEQTTFISGKIIDNETGIEIEMSEIFK